MGDEGCAPNARSFVAALKACSSLAANEVGERVDGKLVKVGCLEKGLAIHCQAAASGYVYLANTLVDMYVKCGSMVDARRVFDRMRHHNAVSWNALMLGYAENGEGGMTLELFSEMARAPDCVTFVAALKACIILAVKEEGKHVDGKLVKTGSVEKGRAMHSQAAASNCDSDIYVSNVLVDMYAKCGSMVDARRTFDRMQHRDVVSWTALILGYAENGEGEMALELFTNMKPAGCAPNVATFVAALKACGVVGALETGEAIHVDLCSCGLQKEIKSLVNCLVDFYAKCGSMVDAQQVFDSLPSTGLVTWTALIAGYSSQGDTNRVFELFHRMRDEGLHADGITFLCVLTVCSPAGPVDKGQEYFDSMPSKYGVGPGIEHYHCMVDTLGRSNQLDNAMTMVPFAPNAVTWTTILGACWKWKNVVVGRLAFESFLRLDGRDSTAHVLMANIYGRMSMWEEQARIESQRAKESPRKCLELTTSIVL